MRALIGSFAVFAAVMAGSAALAQTPPTPQPNPDVTKDKQDLRRDVRDLRQDRRDLHAVAVVQQ